jgi:CubicO group peptidase (beta-lactamase class C family)
MPDNLSSFQDSSYSKADLYRFIAAQTLQQDIGSTWDYSNLDYWLLQEAIATRGRADFEQLMQKRVIAPLGLRSTTLTLSPELQARVAIGHDAVMQPTRPRLRGHDTRRSRSMLQRWIHTLDAMTCRTKALRQSRATAGR